jgi:hypothetical protein
MSYPNLKGTIFCARYWLAQLGCPKPILYEMVLDVTAQEGHLIWGVERYRPVSIQAKGETKTSVTVTIDGVAPSSSAAPECPEDPWTRVEFTGSFREECKEIYIAEDGGFFQGHFEVRKKKKELYLNYIGQTGSSFQVTLKECPDHKHRGKGKGEEPQSQPEQEARRGRGHKGRK